MRSEEWEAVVNARPGKLLKLFTALGFMLGSVRLRSRRGTGEGSVGFLCGLGDALAAVRFPFRRDQVASIEIVVLRLATAIGSKKARWRLAEVYELIGRPNQALDLWHKATRDERAARWFLARRLEATGHRQEAIEVWRLAVASGDAGSWHELAAAVKRLSGPGAAKQIWDEAILAGEPMARAALAHELELLGRFNEAAVLRTQATLANEPGANEKFRHAIYAHVQGAKTNDPFGLLALWANQNGLTIIEINEINAEEIADVLTPTDYINVTDEQWLQLTALHRLGCQGDWGCLDPAP